MAALSAVLVLTSLLIFYAMAKLERDKASKA
jgi:hypothetical protein